MLIILINLFHLMVVLLVSLGIHLSPLIHLKSIQSKQQQQQQQTGRSKSDQLFIWLDYLLIVVGIATVIYSSYQIIFLN